MAESPLSRYVDSRDADAFREIVGDYSDLVYGTCRRILGNRAEVEDAVQETFLKLARRAHEIHSNLGAWLHACARTCALDALKALKRGRIESPLREDDQAPDDQRQKTEASEDSRVVDSCIDELPPLDREVVLSYFFVEQTQEEIASRIGVSRIAIKKRLDKALEALRRKFLRRGLALPGLVSAFLVEARAEARMPAEMAERLSEMNVATAVPSSALPVALTAAGSTSAIKIAACACAGIAALASGFAAWTALRQEMPPFQALVTFERGPSDAFVRLRGDWSWQAPEGEKPALMAVREHKDSVNEVEVMLRDPPPDRILMATLKLRMVDYGNTSMYIGWISDGSALPSRIWQSKDRVVQANDGIISIRAFLTPTDVFEMSGTDLHRLVGLYQYGELRSRHLFLRLRNIGLESLEVREPSPSEIPAEIAKPEEVPAKYGLEQRSNQRVVK